MRKTVKFEFDTQTISAMSDVQMVLRAASRVEAVRRSLDLTLLLLKEKRTGAKLYLVKNTGEKVEVLIS